ncbi:MAG: glycosyltransferase family 4 protein, partial [Undibacterium sp.]
MRIGIDASRALLRRRTGIEEYSYRVIEHLRNEIPNETVTLYVPKRLVFEGGRLHFVLPAIDFEIPKMWKVKGLWAPRFWTQIRLSLEMILSPVNVLFVPAHTVPLFHPKRTIVTIHGLEYEFSPESYGFLARLYMRYSIRYSVLMAKQVIAVSENTKQDLIRLYNVPEEKIRVIYEGFTRKEPDQLSRVKMGKPYFFFVGRLETRKNIIRIIEAFERFKDGTGLSHELILAGKPGYGYEMIEGRIRASKYKEDIQEVGYVSEEERWRYLKGAEAFLFPSLYEGFGLPVIDAQSIGVPVITSNSSSLPEIAGDGAVFIDPMNPQALAEAMSEVVKNPVKR